MLTEVRKVLLDTPEYSLTLGLRERVLLAPFGIPLEVARADDAHSFHFGIFSAERGACLACLLLVPRASGALQMRQVAVAPESQRSGLGRRLVLDAESWARSEGSTRVYANARETALPFYRALGYAELGEPFVQVGLPHRLVEKKLGRAP